MPNSCTTYDYQSISSPVSLLTIYSHTLVVALKCTTRPRIQAVLNSWYQSVALVDN